MKSHLQRSRLQTILFFILSLIILMIGFSFISVPIYRLFCQITGYGGTISQKEFDSRIISSDHLIKVQFYANVANDLNWKFEPLQREIFTKIGEPVLVFYKVSNLQEKTIGIASYNVVPQQAGIYFNKIQCFCFEEQQLNENEEIEMPVLFYIDPEILNDPTLSDLNTISLSYTFFIKK